MPDVSDYDDQTEWMNACVSEMMHEGEREQDQIIAICLSRWREGKSMKPQRKPQISRASERWSCGASRDLPIAETSRDWDGSAAAKRMLDRASNEEDEVNGATAKRGFLIYDAGNPELRGSYSCPFCDIIDGTLKVIPSGLRAAASRLPQVTDVSQEVKDRARGVLDVYFGRLEKDEEKTVSNKQRLRRKQEPPPVGNKDHDTYMGECLEALGGGEEAMSACAAAWEAAGASEEEKRLRRIRAKQNGEDEDEIDVPDPQEDESQEAFHERCVASVVDQGADEDEASSMCSLAWENKTVSRLRHKTHTGLVDEMTFILSDETPDRMGDTISASGWSLDNFKKNPIALFNHRADFPIGRWINLRVEGPELRGELKLAPAGTSERIDEIRKLIEADILKAVSVGFRPIHSQPRIMNQKTIGEHFIRQELVESSLVSVPANPNALAIAKNLDVSDEMLGLVFGEHASKANAKSVTSSKIARTTYQTMRTTPAKHGENHGGGGRSMALAQRISDAQARIVVLRDKLTDHLSNVDDTNVSDIQLEVTQELNQQIQAQQKQLALLIESEKFMASTSEDEARNVVPQRNGNGKSPMRTSPYSYSRSPGAQMIPQTKEARFDLIVRAGIIQAFAHRQKIGLEQALMKIAQLYPRYGDEATRAFTEYTAKAEAFPAMTTVPGWAEELVQLIHSDYLELLMPKSVFPSLSNLGLSLSFGRAGRISIPTRNRVPSIGGSFVGEGEPIPVRMAEFRPLILTPKKLAVITTWTREMDEASIPAIEGVLRNAIQEDTAVAIDTVLLDAMPATTVRPPGLLDGVTLITASTATPPFNALVEDLKALSGELITNTYGNVRKMVWIANPQQVLGASLAVMPGVSAFPFKDEVGGGKLLGYPIVESGTVPMGTILAIDAAEFVTVGGEAPRFEISDQATLHMEDDTPSPITNGGTATPVRSLWQTDSIGLRLILPLNWAMRRPGCVAGITGVTW